jgi:uncharacterized membrane protein
MSQETSAANVSLYSGFGHRKFLNPAVLLVLILLLGVALRLYDLGAESYWIDEVYNIIDGQRSLDQIITFPRFDQPPAYHFPLHFWIRAFGTAEVSVRLFSVLAGVCSMVLIYLIGHELFGKEVGLLGAFFMAIAEYQIYYSQEAKFYSFFELTTLLSFLFFIVTIKRGRLLYFALYVLASLIMVYSHTYGVFVLASQNIFIILYWKKHRHLIIGWLLSQALILLAFVPYFFPVLFNEGSIEGTIHSNAGDLPLPSLLDVLRTVYRFIFTARRGRDWEGILINYAVAGLFLVVGLFLYYIRQGKRSWPKEVQGMLAEVRENPDVRSGITLVCCWFLGPILLPFLLSFLIIPLFKDEYMISAAPALYLLLASGLFAIRKITPLTISLGMYLIMIVPSLYNYYARDINEQWREVAAYVERNSGPEEMIIFAPNMGIGIQQKTFDWYYRGALQSCGLSGELTVSPDSILNGFIQCISGHHRFWVIIPDYPNVTSDDRFRSFFLDSSQVPLRKLMEEQFVGISVYLFEFVER